MTDLALFVYSVLYDYNTYSAFTVHIGFSDFLALEKDLTLI